MQPITFYVWFWSSIKGSQTSPVNTHTRTRTHFTQLPPLGGAEIQGFGNPAPAGIFSFLAFPLKLRLFLAASVFSFHTSTDSSQLRPVSCLCLLLLSSRLLLYTETADNQPSVGRRRSIVPLTALIYFYVVAAVLIFLSTCHLKLYLKVRFYIFCSNNQHCYIFSHIFSPTSYMVMWRWE